MQNGKGNDNRKKWIVGGLIGLALLLAAGMAAMQRNGGDEIASAAEGDVVEVVIGDLAASAAASGPVTAPIEAALMLPAGGEVAAVFVEIGDVVAAGEPLLQLDTTDLERSVASMEAALLIQEANLATLLEPATAADVAAAETAVTSAQAALDDLLAGPGEDEVTAAEADVRAAQADIAAASTRLADLTAGASEAEIRAAEIEVEEAQIAATQAAEQHSTILVTEPNRFLDAGRLAEMEQSARQQAVQANANLAVAQEALDDLLAGDGSGIAAAQASVALAAAQRDAAQAQLDLLLAGPSAADVAAAEANLAQAEANLAALADGPSAADVARQTAQVTQAEVNLARAALELAEATLAAPFAGVVTAVHVAEGEAASGVLVEMVDGSALQVVLDVDEVDMGEVRVGQTAVVTLEAWPEEAIPAQVSAIAPEAKANNSALVVYEVYLDLERPDWPIRVGMTANADLITANREDVLLLPNAAINADRSAGTYSVNRVQIAPDGSRSVTEIPVTIGLRDGDYTQITGGLEAGDAVLVGNALPVQQTMGSENGRPFGGGE